MAREKFVFDISKSPELSGRVPGGSGDLRDAILAKSPELKRPRLRVKENFTDAGWFFDPRERSPEILNTREGVEAGLMAKDIDGHDRLVPDHEAAGEAAASDAAEGGQ